MSEVPQADDAERYRAASKSDGHCAPELRVQRLWPCENKGNLSSAGKTVVKTIIALGRELKMRVTVEGVETAKQAAFLDAVNGDQAQGYYLGRTAPASEINSVMLADCKNRFATPRQRR
jgi:hypothetical protein